VDRDPEELAVSAVLLPLEKRRDYRCMRCDVYGTGTECWYCGSDADIVWFESPKWTQPSRWQPQLERAMDPKVSLRQIQCDPEPGPLPW
jgi:hypothetical protein